MRCDGSIASEMADEQETVAAAAAVVVLVSLSEMVAVVVRNELLFGVFVASMWEKWSFSGGRCPQSAGF
ncbi:hypothetical protein AMTR_s00037p00205040 [Amborella trichopoda]|uniref:Uncharacterized protein n=1 Tax=Amborella trichopoda TaxID=13333 RepID=U5D7J5_AMBTC|nr:hypothetical protein AMTR_s00037p00205040 [Amborella trichopoda]